MKRVLRPAATVAGCAAFIALLLGATDVSLVIAAALVCGAWVRLVLLGYGERELQRFERTGRRCSSALTTATPSPRTALLAA